MQRLFERLHVLVVRAAVFVRVAPGGVLADAQAATRPLRERDPIAHGPSLERGVPDERATESFARRVRPEDARRVDEELAARELIGVVAGHAGEAREARVTRRRVVDVEPPVALVGPREAPRVDRVDVARKQVAAVARVDDLRRRAPVVDRREQRLHRRAKAHRERTSLDLERLDGVLAEPQRAGAFALRCRRRETDLELRAGHAHLPLLEVAVQVRITLTDLVEEVRPQRHVAGVGLALDAGDRLRREPAAEAPLVAVLRRRRRDVAGGCGHVGRGAVRSPTRGQSERASEATRRRGRRRGDPSLRTRARRVDLGTHRTRRGPTS